MALVPVVVFSDFTCPFSRVTEAALRRLEVEGRVTVAGHVAFELYPPGTPLPAVSAADVEAVRALAAEAEVEMNVPPLVPRTRKAHELVRLAMARNVYPQAREAVFDAYFRDGRDIGRIDVLVEIGEALGMDPSETRVILDVDTFADAVIGDAEKARRHGVTGTPALLFGADEGAPMLVGARPLADLRREIEEIGAGRRA